MADIPVKLANATVYFENQELLGIADVELPKVEFDTETLKGLGIAGEIEVVNPAYIKPMNAKLKFNTTTKAFAKLSQPKAHEIEVYGATQFKDDATKEIKYGQVRAYLKATAKTTNTGKAEVGKTMDAEIELTVYVYKLEIDGQLVLEVDPENFVLNIDGTDYLKDVRTALGK